MSTLWSQGRYERIAERFAPIHEQLVERLNPQPGERWLDLGTGTGAIVLLAARAGANVTGLDISETMIETARARLAEQGAEVQLDVGDAQDLPYRSESFDVVSSSFGIVFPPDRERVAAELARVCRAGGRLGLTAWRPRPQQQEIYERFREGPPPAAEHTDWGEEPFLHRLLGGAFQLQIEEHTWYLEGDSAEELYDFMAESAPPTKAYLARLAPEQRDGFRAAMVGYWRQFEQDLGVREPRRYLLAAGTRR